MSDLIAALADEGIRLRSYRPGSNHRLVCPRCEDAEKSLAVTLDEDGGAVWICHRGKCGWTGNVPGDRPQHRREPPRRPVQPPARHEVQERTTPLYAYWARRNVSRETVDAFGLFMAPKRFPQQHASERGPLTAIVFPYVEGGEVVNHKYRGYLHARDKEGNLLFDADGSAIRKKIHTQDSGARRSLYNIDAIETQDVMFAVEGEPDVLAMWECGYRQVVSLPDGADKNLRDENDPRRATDTRWEALENCWDRLADMERVYIAGDMDAPGMNLREEWARRMGKHRCWVVQWPEGCKDVGDVLREHGADMVRRCVDAAKPWPVEGVYDGVSAAELLVHRDERRKPPLTTGWPSVDTLFRLPQNGAFCVVTGVPGHGKTSFMNGLIVNAAVHHGWKTAICSPEMDRLDLAANLSSIYTKRPFYGQDAMPPHEIERATNFISKHLTFLDRGEEAPTVDWILNRAAGVVRRRGIRQLIIDPWNEIDTSSVEMDDPKQREQEARRRQRLLESDRIGEVLVQMRRFSRAHDVIVWLVAHPKMMRRDKDGNFPMPKGYDIASSAHFNNKPDLGLTIGRGQDSTKICVWKARHRYWAQMGEVELMYRPEVGVFWDPTAPVQAAA